MGGDRRSGYPAPGSGAAARPVAGARLHRAARGDGRHGVPAGRRGRAGAQARARVALGRPRGAHRRPQQPRPALRGPRPARGHRLREPAVRPALGDSRHPARAQLPRRRGAGKADHLRVDEGLTSALPPNELPLLRERLLAWYDVHRRDLPWRAPPGEAGDPYRVWLSEVMLQQTRVETVKPYFHRWLERFPTLHSLAEAPLDDVLKAWEGLGYYSRARNFHRAVREVAERHSGRVPDDPAAFRALPGVGRYTAGAVMSIAFGREEALVDGNVRRVFARWADDPAPAEPALWSLAGALAPGARPGDVNQAVMELGATVCVPRTPLCGECPVRAHCRAFRHGTQAERPAPKKAKPTPHEDTAVAVVEHEGRTLLVRRPVDARLGGMWAFP
ncbi:MAG: A/G-specific adenine glycosylase, partial [Gemmatimonadetes bacterium]|nr:A/G-specific adenine glycosylase [Gemmatimonadota bacterium]